MQEALINSEAYTEGVLYNVRIEQLEPNPNNPRRDFDEGLLRELAESIREVGILQPLVATAGDGPAWRGEKLRIVSGERRWRAAQMAGLKSVPVIIRRLTPEQEMQMLLIENLQREDMDPLEEARALDALLKQYGWTQRALGEKLGKSQAWIANRVRLLRLPEKVRDMISRGILSTHHGQVLVKLADWPKLCIHVAERFVEYDVPSKYADEKLRNVVRYHKEVRTLDPRHYPYPRFDVEACAGCRNRMKLEGDEDEGAEYLCLDIKCWTRKQDEAVKEQHRRRVEARERVLRQLEEEAAERLDAWVREAKEVAEEEGTGPEGTPECGSEASAPGDEGIDLTGLVPYDDYRYLWPANSFGHPEEEPTAEECRADGCRYCRRPRAADRRGGAELVCLNPECYERKRKEKCRRLSRERRVRTKSFEQEKDDLLQALPAPPDRRTLVYLAVQAARYPVCTAEGWTPDKLHRGLYARYGWPYPEEPWKNYAPDLTARLKELPDEDLWRIIYYGFVRGVGANDPAYRAVFGDVEEEQEADS